MGRLTDGKGIIEPKPIVDVTDQAEIQSDSDLLTTNITPIRSPSIFRLTIALNAAGVFYVTGLSTTRQALNDGTNLDADELYAFDIPVRAGDSINFQHSVNAIVRVLRVDEVDAGSP